MGQLMQMFCQDRKSSVFCVCVRYLHTYIYTRIHVCVCVCVLEGSFLCN